jgi:hypothetical protein
MSPNQIAIILMITQAIQDLEREVSMLKKIDGHNRIVSYLGACYQPHPIHKGEECLHVVMAFMPGVREYLINSRVSCQHHVHTQIIVIL